MGPKDIHDPDISLNFSKQCPVEFGPGNNPVCNFTCRDQLGPYYEPSFMKNMNLTTKVAPDNELRDPNQFVDLRGTIRNKQCKPIKGATVDFWYAGQGSRGGPESKSDYTLLRKDTEMWYRGKTITDENGGYQFEATFPHEYGGRPILHYHFMVYKDLTRR